MVDLLGQVLDEDQIYYPDPSEGIKDRHVAIGADIAQAKIKDLPARLQQLENAIGQSGGGGGGGSPDRYEILNATQHPTYQLAIAPTLPSRSRLFIRGVKATFGEDYTISGSVLSWIGYSLPTNKRVEIYYA